MATPKKTTAKKTTAKKTVSKSAKPKKKLTASEVSKKGWITRRKNAKKPSR